MDSLSPGFASVLTIPSPSSHWLDRQLLRTELAKPHCEDLVEAIRQSGQSVTIGRDETLFCEGECAEAVYVVLSGTVRNSKMLPDGRRQIIGFHEAGDLIGLALADDYFYSAEGVTAVRLRRMSRSQLEALIECQPRLRNRLLSLATRALAAAQKQMLLLGRKTARERLCSFLIERRRDDGHRIELPMSRTDIADYLGLTIETVSRTLSQLRAEGLIRLATLHSVELTDAGRLSDLAEAA